MAGKLVANGVILTNGPKNYLRNQCQHAELCLWVTKWWWKLEYYRWCEGLTLGDVSSNSHGPLLLDLDV